MEGLILKKDMITLHYHIDHLQSCFDIFVVVFSAPFSWKSLFLLGAVKCGCLVNIREGTDDLFLLRKAFHRKCFSGGEEAIHSIFSSK